MGHNSEVPPRPPPTGDLVFLHKETAEPAGIPQQTTTSREQGAERPLERFWAEDTPCEVGGSWADDTQCEITRLKAFMMARIEAVESVVESAIGAKLPSAQEHRGGASGKCPNLELRLDSINDTVNFLHTEFMVQREQRDSDLESFRKEIIDKQEEFLEGMLQREKAFLHTELTVQREQRESDLKSFRNELIGKQEFSQEMLQREFTVQREQRESDLKSLRNELIGKQEEFSQEILQRELAVQRVQRESDLKSLRSEIIGKQEEFLQEMLQRGFAVQLEQRESDLRSLRNELIGKQEEFSQEMLQREFTVQREQRESDLKSLRHELIGKQEEFLAEMLQREFTVQREQRGSDLKSLRNELIGKQEEFLEEMLQREKTRAISVPIVASPRKEEPEAKRNDYEDQLAKHRAMELEVNRLDKELKNTKRNVVELMQSLRSELDGKHEMLVVQQADTDTKMTNHLEKFNEELESRRQELFDYVQTLILNSQESIRQEIDEKHAQMEVDLADRHKSVREEIGNICLLYDQIWELGKKEIASRQRELVDMLQEGGLVKSILGDALRQQLAGSFTEDHTAVLRALREEYGSPMKSQDAPSVRDDVSLNATNGSVSMHSELSALAMALGEERGASAPEEAQAAPANLGDYFKLFVEATLIINSRISALEELPPFPQVKMREEARMDADRKFLKMVVQAAAKLESRVAVLEEDTKAKSEAAVSWEGTTRAPVSPTRSLSSSRPTLEQFREGASATPQSIASSRVTRERFREAHAPTGPRSPLRSTSPSASSFRAVPAQGAACRSTSPSGKILERFRDCCLGASPRDSFDAALRARLQPSDMAPYA